MAKHANYVHPTKRDVPASDEHYDVSMDDALFFDPMDNADVREYMRREDVAEKQYQILRDLVNFTNRVRGEPHLCCNATASQWDELVAMMNT